MKDDTLIKLRTQLMKKMEYVRQYPADPANILRKWEMVVLQDQIRMLEEMEKEEEHG